MGTALRTSSTTAFYSVALNPTSGDLGPEAVTITQRECRHRLFTRFAAFSISAIGLRAPWRAIDGCARTRHRASRSKPAVRRHSLDAADFEISHLDAASPQPAQLFRSTMPVRRRLNVGFWPELLLGMPYAKVGNVPRRGALLPAARDQNKSFAGRFLNSEV